MMSLDYRDFDASRLNSMNSSSNMGNKIHVLLVEHESIDHDNIINMLRCFNYEVTSVKHASSGLSVVSKEKAQFDVVIANMSSPDSFGYQLLQLALNMNLLVILTWNEEDAARTMMALEQGVFLCVKKPVTLQVLGYLWQHVSREKKAACAQNPPDDYYNKGKVWTQWTVELHTKFMNAATTLGPGRCYPKDILELMNVPGLTRMQVASHLQKCRNAKWLPPHQRKTKQAPNYQEITSLRPKKGPRARPASFGSMPVFDDVIIQEHDHIPCNMINLQQFSTAFNPTVDPDQYLGIDESAMYQTSLTPIIPLGDLMTLPRDAFIDPMMMGQDFTQFQQPELDSNVQTCRQEDIQVGNASDEYWAYAGFHPMNDIDGTDGWQMF